MLARVSPLALTALLVLGGTSPAQYPGMPRPYDPFAPHQPGPFGPRPGAPWTGHFPGSRGPMSARPNPRLPAFPQPRRRDEEDNLNRLKLAAEVGQHAGHLFEGHRAAPKVNPHLKVSVPAVSSPMVRSGGSWLSWTGSSARSWLAGAAAAVAAALAAVFRPREHR